MIEFDQVGGVYLISWFPCVVALRVSFPFDEILESSRPSMMLVVSDTLHFVFFFSVDKVRRWTGEIWFM